MAPKGDERKTQPAASPAPPRTPGRAKWVALVAGKVIVATLIKRANPPAEVWIALVVVLIGFVVVHWWRKRANGDLDHAPSAAARALPPTPPGRRLGDPYALERRHGDRPATARTWLRVTEKGLRFDPAGVSGDLPGGRVDRIVVDGRTFAFHRAGGALLETLVVSESDVERLAWELAVRFPDAMERGLAGGPKAAARAAS